MKKYIGTKQIEAEPMTRGEYAKYSGRNSILIEKGESKSDEGYLVKYNDGYVSWSPKQQFDEAYRECNDMSFGLAIEVLKQGKKVARVGWNGKGMHLFLINSATLLTNNKAYTTKDTISETKIKATELCPFICMKTAQGNVVPWLASQTDVLSEDWQIID